MPLVFAVLLAGENKPPLELGADGAEKLNAFAEGSAADVDCAFASMVDFT
jgi:hypothetical protein